MQSGKKSSIHAVLMLAASVVLLCHAKSAQGVSEGSFSVSTSVEFTHGDYGSDQDSDSYQLPMSLSYAVTETISVAIGTSYIHQSDDSTIAMGGGRFPMHRSSADGGDGMQGSTGSGGSGGMDGSGGMGGQGGISGGANEQLSSDSQQGFGDITLTVDYTLLSEGENAPMVSALLYAKIPTADEGKFLGTGAFDYGGGLGVTKGFGNWLVFAEWLYIMPGSKDDLEPENYWSWRASTNYPVTDRLYFSIEVSGATTPFEGADDVLDLQLRAGYQTSKSASIGSYVATGLSHASADLGVGVYGAISF